MPSSNNSRQVNQEAMRVRASRARAMSIRQSGTHAPRRFTLATTYCPCPERKSHRCHQVPHPPCWMKLRSHRRLEPKILISRSRRQAAPVPSLFPEANFKVWCQTRWWVVVRCQLDQMNFQRSWTYLGEHIQLYIHDDLVQRFGIDSWPERVKGLGVTCVLSHIALGYNGARSDVRVLVIRGGDTSVWRYMNNHRMECVISARSMIPYCRAMSVLYCHGLVAKRATQAAAKNTNENMFANTTKKGCLGRR
jgi:hypothetical protein